MVFIAMLLTIPERDSTKIPTKAKLAQLDGLGLVTLLGGIVCILIALEWGGTTYPWNSGRIIALLVVGLLSIIAFIIVQILLPKTATVAPRIFGQRSIWTAAFTMFCTGAVMMTTFYYLPIWFQAVEGVSAVESGIRLLPLVIGQVIGSLAGGILIQRLGYYTPIMLVAIVVMCVGSGLLTTLKPYTTEGQWIGYQIPFGIGLGCTMQAPLLAAQTVLKRDEAPIGTSLMFFTQLFGGSIFVSVGQNLFDNYFIQRLVGVPGVNVGSVLQQGATTIVDIPEPTKDIVVAAYNDALRKVFLAGLIMACLSILGGLGMEWRSVKKPVATKVPDKEAGDHQSRDAPLSEEDEKKEEIREENTSGSEQPTAASDA